MCYQLYNSVISQSQTSKQQNSIYKELYESDGKEELQQLWTSLAWHVCA